MAHPDAAFREKWVKKLYQAQEEICKGIEAVESNKDCKFIAEEWSRGEGLGGGRSCVIQNGIDFEKGGVNVSAVYGPLHAEAAKEMTSRDQFIDIPQDSKFAFFAAGLSLVIHTTNPLAPTAHANFRFMQIFTMKSEHMPTEQGLPEFHPDVCTPIGWWFGGGIDLSPSFVLEEDCIYFHQTLKTTCDKHSPLYYPRFKKWCDKYFRNHHRDEARGIGGIFFDDLHIPNGHEQVFAFCADGLDTFVPAYVPILEKRVHLPFTESQKRWQQLRRGRYVEFNLIHDRGTKFGLYMPNSRVESILMSLPVTARWEYNVVCTEDMEHEKASLEIFKVNKDWVPIDPSTLEGWTVPVERTAKMITS